MSDQGLLIAFSLACFLLFGFMAWKPQVWASLTPFKPWRVEKLTSIYRWFAMCTLVGVLANLLILLITKR
jgi:hypothetical protein